jgi:menaquinone-dependent protoporphyrinogen oxidase
MNILFIYGSSEGQTKKISGLIADIISSKGHQVTLQPGNQLPADSSIDTYDAAIIGSSIHMGDYPDYIKEFVITHRDWLNTIPTAFFTVCMSVHSQLARSRDEAVRYRDGFLAETGWLPKLTKTFSGAVKYTEYNFITRFIMKLVSKREGASTDTSRDHEYTDWVSVERFAEKIIVEMSDLVR